MFCQISSLSAVEFQEQSEMPYPALQSALAYTSPVVRNSSIIDLAYFSSISARERKNTATC